MSLLDAILPIKLLAKLIIIIIIGLMTAIGVYILPRGKFVVIIIGVIAILLVWYIDLEINL